MAVTLVLLVFGLESAAGALAVLHPMTGEWLLARIDEARRNYIRNKVGYTDIGGTSPVQ